MKVFFCMHWQRDLFVPLCIVEVFGLYYLENGLEKWTMCTLIKRHECKEVQYIHALV